MKRKSVHFARWVCRFSLFVGGFLLLMIMMMMSLLPLTQQVQAQEPIASPEPAFDLTGNRVINASDAWRVADGWLMAAEAGECMVQHASFAERDLDGNGCLSVADVQMVLAHWGQLADADAPLLFPSAVLTETTFVVDVASDESDSDLDDGICQTAAADCTLRAALEQANIRAGRETIAFDIRNPDDSCPDLVTIQPSSELVVDDAHGDGVTIDGYTQCNASANTEDIVGNAQIKIEIYGNDVENMYGLTVHSSNNIIRGLAIYDFNPYQLYISGGSSYNRLQGNIIGTNADMSFSKLWDGSKGLHFHWGASYNVIGCGVYDQQTYLPCQTQAAFNAARNLVAGNSNDGVTIQGDVVGMRFVGNYVGLKQDGSTRLLNGSDGIDFGHGAQENWVGGTLPGERNIISGNNGDGVEFAHGSTTSSNHVVGNYIGLTADGTQPLINYGNGVTLEDTVDSINIYQNVISGNGANGIRIYMLITNSQIHDNLIGVASDGITSMPNGTSQNTTDGRAGIFAMGGSQHNQIRNNVIANNIAQGVHFSNRSDHDDGFGETFYNTISQNSIYNNGTSGIYFNPAIDPATNEEVFPNQGLPEPTITEATTNTVSGSACANCTIEIFIADKETVDDPSGENNGEGKTFIGSGQADANGNFVVLVSGVGIGQIVTATATDALGNSSPFARNVAVAESPPDSTPTPTSTPTATQTAQTATPTPTATQTATRTPTATPSASTTATQTATRTPTATPTATGTPTATQAVSSTLTASPTATATTNPVGTSTPTATGSVTPHAVGTSTPTATGTVTPHAVGTSTPTATGTVTPDAVGTSTPTATGSVTPDAVGTSTPTATGSVTPNPVETSTPTVTAIATTNPLETGTPTATATATSTGGTSHSVQVRILNWADDAEQRLRDGMTYRGSSDLELIDDRSYNGEQIVGLRFQNTLIPQGARITRAYLEVTTDERDSEATSLLLRGEASDNTAPFLYRKDNLSNRPVTQASVPWEELPPWLVVHETHQSPDLSPLIQEIVDRSGWQAGNALVLLVSGSGQRTMEAYDGEPEMGASLYVEYSLDRLIQPMATSTPEPIPQKVPGDTTFEASLWLPIVTK